MIRTFSRRKPVALLCFGLLSAWNPSAAAQPLDESLSQAPAQTQFVLVIDTLKEFHATPVGESWATLLTSLYPVDGDGRKAWQQLATMLGRNETQAFDALFGQRVTFMCASLWDEKRETEWLLASQVARGFERTLLRALKAAPRQIVNNVPVFALEQGRFFLATKSKGNTTELLVCPHGSLTLLLDYVKDTEPLRYDRDSIRTLQAQDALLWIKGQDEDPWWGAGAVSVLNQHTAIDALLRFDRNQLISEPWDASPWLNVDEPDIVRVVERTSTDLPFKPIVSIAPALLKLVQEAEATPTKSILSVRQQTDDALAFGLALEFPHTPDLAFNLDRTTAGFLVWVGEKIGKPLVRHDFNGKYPDAVRLVPLEKSFIFHLIGPSPLTIAWKQLEHQDTTTWWGWGTTPEILPTLMQSSDSEHMPQMPRDWITTGIAHPRKLIHVLHNSSLPLPKRIRPISLLEKIQWWIWLEDANTARGTIVLDLLPPKNQMP